MYVSNVTDIEDKIIAGADGGHDGARARAAVRGRVLAPDGRVSTSCAPDEMPRATEWIDQMQALIAELIERGHA